MAAFRSAGIETPVVSVRVAAEKASAVKRSVAQAAENEATFRLANERLEQKAEELELSGERTPYLCECEDETCTNVVLLRREEYEAVRAHPRRFVLTPGHQGDDDRVVQTQSDFAVIEKEGEEGELVAGQDPRSA
jgi:hypothetical protein